MQAQNLEQFVAYLAEHGIDDSCSDLNTLIEQGRVAGSWVRSKARIALAETAAAVPPADVNTKTLTDRLCERVAELQLSCDVAIEALLRPLQAEQLQAVDAELSRHQSTRGRPVPLYSNSRSARIHAVGNTPSCQAYASYESGNGATTHVGINTRDHR